MAEAVDFNRTASDEVKEMYCDPCSKGGNVVSAEGFCVDCSEYLCAQCYTSHRRFRAMENHVLQDKNSMPDPADSTRGVNDVCEEKCSSHPSKVVEFFCETCDILGCNACITVNHRQCEKVDHIPDIVKDLETSEEFTKFDEIFANIAKNLDKYKEKIATNTEINEEMMKLAKEELKKQRNEINKFFDELENKMDNEIKQIEKANSAALKAALDRFEAVENEFIEMKTLIDLKKKGQNCELFIAIKKNKQKIETINDRFNKLLDERIIQRYTLLPSEHIKAMMRTTTEICRITTAQFQGKIDLHPIKDKKSPFIWGLANFHEHYCVVTDHANKCVKVVDTRRMCVTSEIGVDAENVYSVTKVRNSWAAVSVLLPRNKSQIRFFSVSFSGQIMRTAKQFDVQYACSDLSYGNYYGDENLFLCQYNEIHVYSITGQIEQIIHHDSALLENLVGICLSPDSETIYVTDNKKNSVISLTVDGNVKAIYQNKDLSEPQSITTDKEGNVYVYSSGLSSIHQLTADLHTGQIIIDNVAGAAITYSDKRNKLYIIDDNCVSVYDLKKH